MEDLTRILDKIDKIDDKISTIDSTLLRNTITLEEHVRRTSILEAEIKPLKKHVILVESFFKITGFVVTIAGILAGIIKVIYEISR